MNFVERFIAGECEIKDIMKESEEYTKERSIDDLHTFLGLSRKSLHMFLSDGDFAALEGRIRRNVTWKQPAEPIKVVYCNHLSPHNRCLAFNKLCCHNCFNYTVCTDRCYHTKVCEAMKPVEVKSFDELFYHIFNIEYEANFICGRDACIALIKYCQEEDPGTDYGNVHTGKMNFENIRELLGMVPEQQGD